MCRAATPAFDRFEARRSQPLAFLPQTFANMCGVWCRYSHCSSVHHDQLLITHGYFYNTEVKGPQWLSDTWTMSLHSPYAMHEIHSAYWLAAAARLCCWLSLCTSATVLQRVSAIQQQQRCIRRRKHRLFPLADTVHHVLHTMTSCGCLLAVMAATASMATVDMS